MTRDAKLLLTVRYVVPGVLVVAGLVFLVVARSDTKAEAWALFTGAGLSIFLLNALYRFGVQGDLERDREDAARDYFDEQGRWPDDEEQPAGRRWTLPEGVVMPEQPSEPPRSVDPR